MVDSDIMSGIYKFLVIWNQRLKPHKNVPEHFHLSPQNKKLEIMVGLWSRAILWADFKNFWFFEISGSSGTTMSLTTCFYLAF